MKSFRLYVGERHYLTAAGWLSLLLAIVATTFTGYVGAKWLADNLGPGRSMIWIVAAAGLVAWGACWLVFRAAGYPLIAEIPACDATSEPGAGTSSTHGQI